MKINLDPKEIDSKAFQKMLSMQIKEMNSALAKQKTLRELLQEEKPESVTNSGHTYTFDKNALMKLTQIVPKFNRNSLKLPIYLYLDVNVPDQYYINDELQAEVFKKLGNLSDNYEFRNGKLWIPRTIGKMVHRKYPSILQYFWLP
ncbi:MAG TPA: DUF61 family protein [Candidatus Altiarchaeales archaeon]|nr:DUF61 family protein [Candidatus Altiarchaeales archaeon]